MKKILIKVVSAIASLAVIPCNCMAWKDEAIKNAYETFFGAEYVNSCYGLKALTSSFKQLHPTILTLTTKEAMQDYLENNYETFKTVFENIDRQLLKSKYEEYREHKQTYYQENCDKILEYQQAYYQENRDKILEYQQTYRQENREKIRESNHNFLQNHPGYYTTHDKASVQKALGSFSKECAKHTQKRIQDLLGQRLTCPELLSVAQIISRKTSLQLNRECKRRKIVLLKWFDENWDRISPIIANLKLETTE